MSDEPMSNDPYAVPPSGKNWFAEVIRYGIIIGLLAVAYHFGRPIWMPLFNQ